MRGGRGEGRRREEGGSLGSGNSEKWRFPRLLPFDLAYRGENAVGRDLIKIKMAVTESFFYLRLV